MESGGVAVITGAASGIGLAAAKRCGELGMAVVISDVDGEALSSVEASITAAGARAVLAITADVSDEQQVQDLSAQVFEQFGPVSFLFLNAGLNKGSSVLASTTSDWQLTLRVNLFGVLNGIQAFVPRMREQGSQGQIVATSSIAGLINAAFVGGASSSAAYTTSKHGVTLVMEALEQELRSSGVTNLSTHILCPAGVSSGFHAAGQS